MPKNTKTCQFSSLLHDFLFKNTFKIRKILQLGTEKTCTSSVYFTNLTGMTAFGSKGEEDSSVCTAASLRLLADSHVSLVVNICLNIFVCITAALGNILILATIWRNPSLRSPSTILLANLALSDFCVGFIAEPVYIMILVFLFNSGDVSCAHTVASTVLNCFLSEVTFFTIISISIDRYLAITFHLRYQELVTEKRTKIFVACLWITCGLSLTLLTNIQVLKWLIILAVTSSIVVLSFAWIKIYRAVRHHQNQIHVQLQVPGQQVDMARMKKSVMNTWYILFAFFISYFPIIIALAIWRAGSNNLNYEVFVIAYTVVLLNSSVNPLVYCWRLRDIRTALKQTITNCFRSTQN